MEDLQTQISDAIYLFSNDVIEEHYSDQIFLEDEIYDDEMIEMFLKRFRKKFLTMSDPYFYLVQRKEDDAIGTMICEVEYDFEYRYSGFILKKELGKSISRKRDNN